MNDFDRMVQFYVSCAVSQAEGRVGRSRFIRNSMQSLTGRERIAARAAAFQIARKGKERRFFVNEARAEFYNVR